MGGCKNIAVSKNKTIGLYDFDISVIDETPLTRSLKRIFETKGPTFEYYANQLRIFIMRCLGFEYNVVTHDSTQTSL